MLKTCPLPMLKAIIPLGPLNLAWSVRSLYQLVIDNRRHFFTNEWMCMEIECPFHVLHLIRVFFQNEDMKRYTRNSVFHMTHASMYKSIHMAIWNGCHIRQYSINFDWFYWLSFFTELKLTIFWSYHRSLTPTPQKNPPGHKTTSIYCISGQKLQLDLTFNSWFSNIHWYYRIHVVTFPYLSELPPNMNEWMQN